MVDNLGIEFQLLITKINQNLRDVFDNKQEKMRENWPYLIMSTETIRQIKCQNHANSQYNTFSDSNFTAQIEMLNVL